ncbi:MAG: hypothetical protein HeimC3_47570, partial [Candidatus Heimdallarchaeota archaeon LC_3]
MFNEQLPIDLSKIPDRISGLRALAYNLWSYWNHNALELWKNLDAILWSDSEHNPVFVLQKVSKEKFS